MQIQKSERPTIMSGKVVTLATAFEKEPGIFGDMDGAVGPFEVSVSRDAVMVHRAELRTLEDVDLLIEALHESKSQLIRLRAANNGYGG